MEAAALLGLGGGDGELGLLEGLGARVVDAGIVEQSVLQRCDAAEELQRSREELLRSQREVARLQATSAAAQRAAARQAPRAPAGPGAARQEARCAADELSHARERARILQDTVGELEQTLREEASLSLSAGGGSEGSTTGASRRRNIRIRIAPGGDPPPADSAASAPAPAPAPVEQPATSATSASSAPTQSAPAFPAPAGASQHLPVGRQQEPGRWGQLRGALAEPLSFDDSPAASDDEDAGFQLMPPPRPQASRPPAAEPARGQRPQPASREGGAACSDDEDAGSEPARGQRPQPAGHDGGAACSDDEDAGFQLMVPPRPQSPRLPAAEPPAEPAAPTYRSAGSALLARSAASGPPPNADKRSAAAPSKPVAKESEPSKPAIKKGQAPDLSVSDADFLRSLSRFRKAAPRPTPGSSQKEEPPPSPKPKSQEFVATSVKKERPPSPQPASKQQMVLLPPKEFVATSAKKEPPPSPQPASKQQMVPLPPKEEPASPAPKPKREGKLEVKEEPKLELESKLESKEELFEDELAAASSARQTSTKQYRIDASQLKPKAAIMQDRFSGMLRSEAKALLQGSEVVSPHRNLLHRRLGLRLRKRPEATGKRRKGRLDDSNEQAFQRRQRLLVRSAGRASAALVPKQQVDDSGRPLAKLEPSAFDVKLDPGAAPKPQLQADDVHVAEGLRSQRWLWEALYPYQQVCVKRLWGLQQEKLGCLLADEMGLGKTVQIAAYLGILHHSGVLQRMQVQNTSLGAAAAASTGGVLLVCPATLINQWKSELHLWYPALRVCVMHQVGDEERKRAMDAASSSQGILVTSYETLRMCLDELLARSWVVLVLDEGQRIRNPDAQVTLAVKRFSTPHRILLSGSPIQNCLKELWSLFDFICPGRLGTLPVFLEEFAEPIEKGNLMGANEARVAAAFECAKQLRELTQPCIIRRTKAECKDVLKLPPKQEQVLFCNLSPEQYQVYVDFLRTDQVKRARRAQQDRRCAGAAFFSISVLRKLCNHPDLLLRDADKDNQPDDMWNCRRSGKMEVMAKIMKIWKSEGHRALVFVQTVQMLEVIQRWMTEEGYAHLTIDGRTAVKKRTKMIEEFNSSSELFAMLLTTRVGGVGLNIIGADRVILFDPDWNPMTDVQARERAWRIGQKRDVSVYRLVSTGTIEEKIYQRQVYKHFIAQKVLQDARQRQFFKWNDLADLFDVPPPPPDFNSAEMAKIKGAYRGLFKKLDLTHGWDGDTAETKDVMKAISELPESAHNKVGKEAAQENNTILKTLYDSNGIKASFNHDKVEQPLLDRNVVRQSAGVVAKMALEAIQRSSRECASHHISSPTWTGSRGLAGAARAPAGGSSARGGAVKRERADDSNWGSGLLGAGPSKRSSSRASSADILQGLRQLAAIRAHKRMRTGESQAEQAASTGVPKFDCSKPESSVKSEPGVLAIQDGEVFDSSKGVEIEAELGEEDFRIARTILDAFLDPKLSGKDHSLTTGEVVQHLTQDLPKHYHDVFKQLLQQMCWLSNPSRSGEPGVWSLRREFWPASR